MANIVFGLYAAENPKGVSKVIFEILGHEYDSPVGDVPQSISSLPLGSEITLRVVGKDYARTERL